MKNFRATKTLYLFVIPGLVYYALFKYWPIYGSQIAFRDYSPFLGFTKSPWVGLENFERFFRSPDFFLILKNTLLINVTNLILGFPFPIILAILLNQVRNKAFKKLVQTATYAPYFISVVVLVGMMYTMLSPYSGVVNAVIRFFGGDPVHFMGKPGMYVMIYVLSGIWQTCGWSAIVYIAALASVSPDLHESAIVDGAGRLQRIWHIDLPGIMPTMSFNILMQTINAFQMFAAPYTIFNGRGGPLNSAMLYVIYLYQHAFKYFNVGYASALSWALLVMIAGTALILHLLEKKFLNYDD